MEELLEETPCPVCGYDCRGQERCPECGLEAAEFAGRRRQLPWPQRKELGAWTAFWRTASDVLLRPWRLADAALDPVADRDARRFAWICIAIAGPVLAVAAAGVPIMAAGLGQGARASRTFHAFTGLPEPAQLVFSSSWSVEWQLPARLGLSLWTIGLTVLVLAALWPWSLTTPFALVRDEGKITERALRCAGLSRYLSAGLLLLAPAAWLGLGVLESNSNYRGVMELSGRSLQLTGAVALGAWGLAVLTLGALALLWRAGAEGWQVALGALIYLMQVALIAILAAAVCVGLPGLVRCYWEIGK